MVSPTEQTQYCFTICVSPCGLPVISTLAGLQHSLVGLPIRFLFPCLAETKRTFFDCFLFHCPFLASGGEVVANVITLRSTTKSEW